MKYIIIIKEKHELIKLIIIIDYCYFYYKVSLILLFNENIVLLLSYKI